MVWSYLLDNSTVTHNDMDFTVPETKLPITKDNPVLVHADIMVTLGWQYVKNKMFPNGSHKLYVHKNKSETGEEHG